jgi:hypothetical protein
VVRARAALLARVVAVVVRAPEGRGAAARSARHAAEPPLPRAALTSPRLTSPPPPLRSAPTIDDSLPAAQKEALQAQYTAAAAAALREALTQVGPGRGGRGGLGRLGPRLGRLGCRGLQGEAAGPWLR